MGTPLSDIYQLFSMKIKDYRLLALSTSDFNNYLEGWLIPSIVDFYNCDQSLEYDRTSGTFNETLSLVNQNILATLMMKHWMQKEVNDITQFRLHISDRDFKVTSEANNLKAKTEYLIQLKEETDHLLNSYSYSHGDLDKLIG